MKLTDLTLTKIQTHPTIKPLLSITLHQPFLIHHLRLIQANSPLFLPIPTKPTPHPQFPHIPHPINSHIT
ncbi:septation protein SpoVG family protein, partial [Staphylococcus epidermidis]|uniref:septation protein SpoVG family protein n=1 Tax=Staphylococcus epidermidis TaxID=1282 RepID=UPI0011A7921A